MRYNPEVIAYENGKWLFNGQAFVTKKEAQEYIKKQEDAWAAARKKHAPEVEVEYDFHDQIIYD